MTRRKNGSQVQITLRDNSPIERIIGEIYESGEPQKIGYEYVSGAEFLRKLVLLGYDRLQNGKEIPHPINHQETPTKTSHAHKTNPLTNFETEPL